MYNYRKGAYVSGTIESCLTVNVQTLSGQGKDMGSSGGFITMGEVYECYTIPMADSHYIRIMLPDENTVHALEGYVVKQISFSKRRNILYFGLGILAIMIFAIWKGKNISDDFVIERVEESVDVKDSSGK